MEVPLLDQEKQKDPKEKRRRARRREDCYLKVCGLILVAGLIVGLLYLWEKGDQETQEPKNAKTHRIRKRAVNTITLEEGATVSFKCGPVAVDRSLGVNARKYWCRDPCHEKNAKMWESTIKTGRMKVTKSKTDSGMYILIKGVTATDKGRWRCGATCGNCLRIADGWTGTRACFRDRTGMCLSPNPVILNIEVREPMPDLTGAPENTGYLKPPPQGPPPLPTNPNKYEVTVYNRTTSLKKSLAIETGYQQSNVWLDWVHLVAKQNHMTNCVVCSTARPEKYTEPAPLYPIKDELGFQCMLALHMKNEGGQQCSSLAKVFPKDKLGAVPPSFQPKEGKYICLTREGDPSSPNVGTMPPDWCNMTINVSNWKNMTELPVSRMDLYWYSGGRMIRDVLPPNWKGTVTITRLAVPLVVVGTQVKEGEQEGSGSRQKREIEWDLKGPTYFDAIGVPRGVPDADKIADQIADGFASFLCWWCTINKNVDRINYVHYNVQLLSNKTRDAVRGLAEQLAPTSLMAIQNRMALDMLLAKEGGVCTMIGGSCCTFIPNNTAPDGSVTRALAALTALSERMAEDSGVDNVLSGWIEGQFGKWKDLILSALMSMAVFTSIIVTCGCCCIPCIRTLINRLITTALSKETPPPYEMPLLGAPEEEAIPDLPLPLALDSVYEEYGYRSLIPPPAYNLSYGPGPLRLEGRD